MGEQDRLNALGVTGEWIWGDDSQQIVFAQAFDSDRTMIIRFMLPLVDPDPDPEPSLVRRIVACYHGLDVKHGNATFPDRSSMRTALWSAVTETWEECAAHPAASQPDVVIDIYNSLGLEGRLAWRICHESLFNSFIRLLLPPERLKLTQVREIVAFEDLVRLDQLGGRGCATLVRKVTDSEPQLVFKGIDFRTFLTTYADGHIVHEIESFYKSLRLLDGMPRHANIMAPAQTLVTICQPGKSNPVVCGFLFSYQQNGSLSQRIDLATRLKERILLVQKARWCSQMAAALAHTHLVARTYHMDVKPGNFLLDNDSNLLLIDWEQSDAPVTTAAYEVDGTWDVEEIHTASQETTLKYTKYLGPERRNMPESTPGTSGWNTWNVFPVWQKECPKALELAEVFSLGRSMWMLLCQPDTDQLDDVESTEDVVMEWNQESEDIPRNWKDMTQRCVERDPNM